MRGDAGDALDRVYDKEWQSTRFRHHTLLRSSFLNNSDTNFNDSHTMNTEERLSQLEILIIEATKLEEETRDLLKDPENKHMRAEICELAHEFYALSVGLQSKARSIVVRLPKI
jgi:hypothetical protein